MSKRLVAIAMVWGGSAAGLACNGGTPRTPVVACDHDALPPDAILTYASAGGWVPTVVRLTAFADGRVETTETSLGPPGPPQSGRVPPAQITKVVDDVARSGAFQEPSGCWSPSSGVPHGGGTSLVIRDKAGLLHAYAWETGANPPDAVSAALDIAEAFKRETMPRLAPVDAGAPTAPVDAGAPTPAP